MTNIPVNPQCSYELEEPNPIDLSIKWLLNLSTMIFVHNVWPY